jgi:hypothetical protein
MSAVFYYHFVCVIALVAPLRHVALLRFIFLTEKIIKSHLPYSHAQQSCHACKLRNYTCFAI